MCNHTEARGVLQRHFIFFVSLFLGGLVALGGDIGRRCFYFHGWEGRLVQGWIIPQRWRYARATCHDGRKGNEAGNLFVFFLIIVAEIL